MEEKENDRTIWQPKHPSIGSHQKEGKMLIKAPTNSVWGSLSQSNRVHFPLDNIKFIQG